MAAINGTWKFVNSTNLEKYHDVIKATEEYKDRLRQLVAARKANPDIHHEEFEINPSAGTVRRAVFLDNEKKREVTYKIGVVNDNTSADGRPVKVTLGLVGDNKITIHETVSGLEVDGFIEAKGNELTINLSSQGVAFTSTYTKIA